MFVNRDLFDSIQSFTQLESVMLWGPRQVGKTTLLDLLPLKSRLFLDDLGLRQRAQKDPALVLDNLETPVLIDEAQYAPNLFSEIKLRIDEARREALKNQKRTSPMYYLTGSNRTLLDREVKESLAGRSHLMALHGLSVKELKSHFVDLQLKNILYTGGLPLLYTRSELSTEKFLNDYILSFIEKDIARSAGIAKIGEFQTVLRLSAARSGQFLNLHELANTAGVDQKTLSTWIQILETNFLLKLVPTYSTNLSKRVTKMKKLYFFDTGLCSRLQGQTSVESMWNSTQIGGLFETLVFSEIMKTRDNFLKDWQLSTWRTKEKNEIDFILQGSGKTLFLEAKLSIHSASPFELDREAKKVFTENYQKIVVTAGGLRQELGSQTLAIPIFELGKFLLKTLSSQ